MIDSCTKSFKENEHLVKANPPPPRPAQFNACYDNYYHMMVPYPTIHMYEVPLFAFA